MQLISTKEQTECAHEAGRNSLGLV